MQTNTRTKNIVGKVAEFTIDGDGFYCVLIQHATPTVFFGPILRFDSAYSEHCIPASTVPTVSYENFSFDNPDLLGLRFKNATFNDRHFVENAIEAQHRFLQGMVGNGEGPHVYQSLTFNITDVEESNIPHCKFNTRGTYCDMEIENLLSAQMDEAIKNPYVTKSTFHTDDFHSMCTAYDRYVSAAGQLLPDTIITYNLESFSKSPLLPKRKHLCSISVPYKTLREKGLTIFPVELPKNIENLVNDTIVFLQRNKQLWSEQSWAHKETAQDTIERD